MREEREREREYKGASGGYALVGWKPGCEFRSTKGGDRNCGGLGGVQGGSYDGIT